MDSPVRTFLFADLAGFTAMTEVHGDDLAADLAADFGADVQRVLPPAGARIVKSIGDAVFVCFESPAEAVRAGLRIVSSAGGRHGLPVVRVGMHAGPAVQRGGDYFGGAVNLAARVAGIARGGEVLLTQDTLDAVERLDGVSFRSRGPQLFRNLRTQVEIHAATSRDAASPTLPIDPVCHMAVDPALALSRELDGTTFMFCDEACAAEFAASPESFLDVSRTPTG